MASSQNFQRLVSAERTASRLRQFLEIKKSGKTARATAKLLDIPYSWVTGSDCFLTRFERDGLAGLSPENSRDTVPSVDGQELPGWFVPAARYFYLLSNCRRHGGSVPEAVRRTIELPNLPTGWNSQHRARLAEWLSKHSGSKELPVCPLPLKQAILLRLHSGKDPLPRTVARQIASPGAIVQRFRSPRASALDTLSAPGSQRRYYNTVTGSREIMRGGDWFGGDDSTPGIAVCVPSNEINTPCSQKYGVLLGRFQWLAFHDCRTDKILACDYVVRPRGSYRAEDVLNGIGAVTRAHGIPRNGWQFEGGIFDAKLIQQAIDLLGVQHWRTYSPHQKAVESVFNRVWTTLAVQFPHADMGRYRNENEYNCRIYEACKAGHKDPRKFFPTVALMLSVLNEEIARHNAKRIDSTQYGAWIPDELFNVHKLESPLRPFSQNMTWMFSPFSAERKIQGMGVSCAVPMFENFSVPFDFSAPWMPLHRGKLVRIHFNPREPKCQAKVVLLENSGTLKAGHILGDAELIGETAQHVRDVMNWAQDDRQAGYLARQRTGHFLARFTRALGPEGRIIYSADERRDGLGSVVKIERDTQPASRSVHEIQRPARKIDLEMFKGRRGVGKIARLPAHIQDQVNQRLFDGQPYNEILLWLHGLPEVNQILSNQFKGKPITAENLSNWRKDGHLKWLELRHNTFSANAADFSKSREDRERRAAELSRFEKTHQYLRA